MVEVRTCVFLFAVLLHVQVTIAKPFFGLLYCEWFCEEDDDDVTTTTANTDDFEVLCMFCPGPSRPRTTTQSPLTTWQPGNSISGGPPGPGFPPIPFNFNMPPNGNGMSLSLQPGPNGQWTFNWLPGQWGGSGSPPMATTPSAPAATTAGGGAPTTPGAAAATTVAPTTVAPGKK